ncbi:MAG: TonB-dependent receptor [Bacteroidetes bacterium]|nr:MAG: TonB-dependent receptor [Bacteroidota bacterium]
MKKNKYLHSLKKVRRFLLICAVFLLVQLSAFAQISVGGKVSSEEEPAGVLGVNVLIKGTSTGTVTDLDGNFKLQVPDQNAVLVFSFTGFLSQEIVVGSQTNLMVQLQADIKALEEIIVVGYGTQRKRDLTGSITKVGEEDFNQGPITNPLQKLTGRAAGVNITQVGSEPGTNPSIRIRGITSLIGGNDPLVVVDGIQGNLDLLNQIPPSEIESIDILKDASSTAIYGSRGAAGVILVTTKKGTEDKITVEYSGVGSMEVIAKKYDLLNASEWRAEAAKRGVAAASDNGGNTDWFKEVTQVGYTQNHNLAFGGGSKSFNFRASLTAIDQQGIVINSGLKNYIGRLQATQKALNDKLTLNYNVNIGILEKKYNNADVIGGALGARPTDPIYNADGSYFVDKNVFGYTNAYARAKEMIDGAKTNSLFGSLRADYEITDGLTASVFGSWRKTNEAYAQYRSPKTTQQDAVSQNGIATREDKASDETLFNAMLNYRKIVGEHSFDASFIYEWQKQTYDGFKAISRGFSDDLTSYNSLQSGDLTKIQGGDISSYKNDQTLSSFLGRLNYSFKGKYLFTATFRRDGSSKFGANNKWASFPSVSFAWRISDEDFFKKQSIASDLKLRVGYGVTGNQQGLSALNSVRLVEADGTAFFGGGLIPNFSIKQNANPDLRWETRKMLNVGLDFGFLTNKLTGTFDYYYGETTDLLFDYTVPQPPFPFGQIKANVGTVLNTGLELSLNYRLIDEEDFKVILGGNFTRNRNEIKQLNGSINGIPLNNDFVRWGGGGTTGTASTNDGIQYLTTGQPVGTFYLFKHQAVNEQGEQVLTDINGNGSIDDGNRSADRYIAGQALPDFSYAFTPTITYKNFDVSFVLRGVYGNSVYNASRAIRSSLAGFGQKNVLKDAIGTNVSNITYASDLWLESGSFARMENLTLAYRFNTKSSKYLQNLRVSFTANNLFVITAYKGLDPEVSANGGSNDGRGFGTDFGVYPRTRNFAIGLNITFK